MANENNYCACNDGDAHYIIELNQQGAPGQQGEAGAEGFSPEIVYTITDTEFVVKVVNKDGITETPNLFNDYIAKKDLSNTNIASEYLKIDGSNASGSMTLNVPVTTGNLTVGGYLTTPANRPATIPLITTNGISAGNAGMIELGSKCTILSSGAIIYTHPGDNSGYELVNQADIPAVYNSTITLTQGGVTKGSFTLNQSTGATIDLDAGGVGKVDKLSSTVYNTDTQRLVATGFGITNTGMSVTFNTALTSEMQEYDERTEEWVTTGSQTIYPVITSISGSGCISATTTNGATALSLAYDDYTLKLTDNNELKVNENLIPFLASENYFTNANHFGNIEIASGSNILFDGDGGVYYADANDGNINIINRTTGQYGATVTVGSDDAIMILEGATTRPGYKYNNVTSPIALQSDIPTSNEIEAHKAYKSTGELLTDSKGLADVKTYAHSTYDSSKFTSLIHGTPTITTDGLMYGNADNSVGTGLNMNTALIVPNVKNVISIRYTYQKANVSGHAQSLWLARFDSTSNNWLLFASEDNKFSIAVNGTNVGTFYNNVVENQTYDISIVSDFKTYFKIYIDGVEEYSDTTLSLTLTACSMFHIGCNSSWQTTRYNVGAIDLKYLEIKNNGVPVFSGNKTGIDTIKPDNYTVVGSPTISDDGVASGFTTSSDYISFTNAITLGNNFDIFFDITTGSEVTSAQSVLRITDGTNALMALNKGANVTDLRANFTDGTNSPSISGTNLSLSANSHYRLWFKLLDKTLYYYYKTDNNTTWQLNNSTTTDLNITSAISLATLGKNNATLWGGSIDLNSVRIYVNGNLVYQPCLKIPYTSSKTGSKVVDSVYRDRVNDCAEQFGQANYYTLDEINNNFTLPQIELYGLIGQRTLKDTYRNGIFYYDLYSDRTLEQGGSCTSGTDVTFLKPFSDTNYVLTVPYSAKTATGFTPSATGDWIAKGIGEL